MMPQSTRRWLPQIGTIDWAPTSEDGAEYRQLMFIKAGHETIPAINSLAISFRNLQKYL
jgi:hypothetical protein